VGGTATYEGSCPAYDLRIWALRHTGAHFEGLDDAVEDRTDGDTSTGVSVMSVHSLQDLGSTVEFWGVAVEAADIEHASLEIG
jgi:hypothetical protein